MSEFYVKFLSFFNIVSAKHGTENGTGSINMLGMKFGFCFQTPRSQILVGFPTVTTAPLKSVPWEVINGKLWRKLF